MFLAALCLAISTGISAQEELGPKMSAYRDFCLLVNQGFRNADANLLMKSISDCNADDFCYNGEDLLIMPNDQMEPLNGAAAEPAATHIYYQPEYVDSILMLDLVGNPSKYQFLNPAELERGDLYDCAYAYTTLPPHGKGEFALRSAGHTELMAIGLMNGKVRMRIQDETNNVSAEKGGAEGEECVWFCWNMPQPGRVVITLENTTAEQQSFMIVTN